MIRTIADLLSKLTEREAVVMEQMQISHAPTIGKMYEGLTSDVLDRILPDGLDLSVVSGFITNNKGARSGQIDCMLVTGTGVPIPHTSDVLCPVRDVIAVFEVKKNLFSSELASSHVHLLKMLNLHWEDLVHDQSGKVNIEAALHAFQMIVGRSAPARDQIESLPFDEEMIYRALTVELVSPIRIALGYTGFRSENALRHGFTEYLKANLGKRGFSPSMLPNLIVSGRHSLLKLNGLPYSAPRTAQGWWPIVASSHENPLIFILEILWTRLAEHAPMPRWFDEDLGAELLSRLLDCRAVQKGGNMGWEYNGTELSDEDLKGAEEPLEWEPHFLNEFQLTVVAFLCKQESVGDDHPLLENLSAEEKKELEQLFQCRLLGREADKIVLLTRACRTVILPDGRFAAADDSSGRFSAWVTKYLLERRRAAPA